MAENKVKDGNYIMIQSFMVKDLKLKGNELLVYAIIYGFSQEENCVFSGGLQYLADWTCSTKQGIMKCLKSLEEKGLIVKQSLMVNKVVYLTKFNTSIKQSLTDSVKQSLPNNIDNNNINNNIYSSIIDYLNQKAGTSYRANSEKTKSCIRARLNEKFTIEDFKKVIDNKVACWKKTEFEKFLRPETLFGNKFEGYLNEKPVKSANHTNREYTQNQYAEMYTNIEDIDI